MGWTLALWVLCQTADPAAADDDLRRARNEYAFGNYDAAVDRLRGMLQPMRLENDAQAIEVHRLLALAFYLTDREPLAREEFKQLLALAPHFELDPFTVAPPIIDLFEELRRTLYPDAARSAEIALDSDMQTRGVLRTIEYRSTQRSALTTFLPFGVGQFQNGDTGLGIVFATTEAALLAANIACYFAATNMNGYADEQISTIRGLVAAQYTALGLFGLTWGIGALQAYTHFVPVIIETPRVQETPLYGSIP